MNKNPSELERSYESQHSYKAQVWNRATGEWVNVGFGDYKTCKMLLYYTRKKGKLSEDAEVHIIKTIIPIEGFGEGIYEDT